MEFDKLSGANYNIHLPNAEQSKKETPVQIQDVRETPSVDKNSPADPNYWQSVLIKRTPKEGEDASDAIEGAKYLEEAKSKFEEANYWKPDEKKQKYLEKLENIAHLGKDAMDTFLEYAAFSMGLYDSERSARCDILVHDYFENYSETKNMGECLIPLLRTLSAVEDNKFPAAREFFNFVIKDKEHSAQEKNDWLSFYSDDPLFINTQEDNLKSLDSFSRYISIAGDDSERMALNRVRIPKESVEKVMALLDSGKISSEDYAEFAGSVREYYADEKSALISAIDSLYEHIVNENDETCGEYFKNLLSPKLALRYLSVTEIADLIRKNDSVKKQMTSKLVETGKAHNCFMFDDIRDYTKVVDMLNSDNFADFRECFDIEAEKDSKFSKYYFYNDYKNPKTGLFDKKLYTAADEYRKKTEKYGANKYSWFGGSAPMVISAAVDMKTGEISPDAANFIDKYYFDVNKDTKANKIKTFVKTLGGLRYVQAPFYKRGIESDDTLAKVLNVMKDNEGTFNPLNLKYMSKIMEWPMSAYSPVAEFFDELKDENGIIDLSRFKFAKNIFNKTFDLKAVRDVMNIFKTLGNDEAVLAYNTALEMFNSEGAALINLNKFVEYCWGDGEDKVNNMFFVSDLSKNIDFGLSLDDDLFEVSKNENNKNYILEFIEKYKSFPKSYARVDGWDVNTLCRIIKRYADEKGELPDFVKEKLEKFSATGAGLYNFEKLFDICTTNEDNFENGFKDSDFEKIANLFAANPHIGLDIELEYLVGIVNGGLNPFTLKFKDKISLLNAFMTLKERPQKNGFDIDFIDKIINDLDKSIRDESVFIPVSKEDKAVFVCDILASAKTDKKGYTEFENILKDSIPLLEAKTSGIEITFPLEKFVSDLSDLCGGDEDKIKILKDKTGISPIFDEKDGKKEIMGYNGILLLDKLNKEDDFEGRLYNLIHRFLYENEVITQDEKLNKELNKIIKACPELINIIGKPQHGTHKYPLDVHSLLVLAYSIDNPDYLKLNSPDKVMLKTAALFHDIAKQQGVVDEGHQEPSSIYARSIVKKFFKNEDIKDRIYELVKNHHWLVQYNNASNKEQSAKETAYKFRRPNDFDIAKIMARADLMAVSPEFYNKHKNALEARKLEPVKNYLNEFYSTGNVLFSNHPLSSRISDKCIQSLNGREFKVINLHELNNNADMFEYGFEPGVTKKDLILLVHMVDENSIAQSLKKVDMLTSPVNGGVLSESVITPEYKRTYCNRKYGVILSQINANLVNMNSSNQSSGCEKDFSNIINLVFLNNVSRNNFKEAFLKNLKLNSSDVSDNEFAEFYKNNLVSKTSFFQFVSSKEFKLGGKTFTGDEISSAIKKFQNSLIDKLELTHNELVGYIPKIQAVVAKEKSLKDVPKELLDFAHDNNLPVVLI